ncbi:MAG: hypothetical protein KA419_07160 [Acidobacteria bacterium]|nr:hypothetical protein [Acidobacteriota bacterium]
MSRPCTICTHPNRAEIEAAILANKPVLRIVADCGGTEGSIRRHRDDCMKEAVTAAREAQEEERITAGMTTLEQCRALQEATLGILNDARESDPVLALRAIDSARKNLELLSKLLGDIDESPRVNIIVMPEWVTLRERILCALEPFPEARAALARTVEGG